MTDAPRSILVASDLSARSDRALARAFRLAQALEAELTVAHIVDDAMPPDMARDVEISATETLERQAALVAGECRFEVVTRIGHPATDVLALIEERAPGLVVVGSHRARGFLAALRETTAQRVVRLSDRPVLVANDPVEHDYSRILAATDFSPAGTAALQLGHAIAPQARVVPVHALHMPYPGMLAAGGGTGEALQASFRAEAQSLARSWRDANPLPEHALDEIVIEAGSPFMVLQKVRQSGGGDLVTVGAHGRVGAAPALLGSLASDLMRHPFCDVLVARP